MLAFDRPHSWDFVLFIHILGATVLVGAVVLATAALAGAWKNGSVPLVQLGFRSLLWAALPAYVVMRIGAESIACRTRRE